MKRFALRMVPIAAMIAPLPVYNYYDHQAEEWYRLRIHTYEARDLARRLSCGAGHRPEPGQLRVDLEVFARETADNAEQVANVAAMRRALAPFDPAEVDRIALAMVAEEERLLPIRDAGARRSGRMAWLSVGSIAVAGFMVAVFLECVEWFKRRGPHDGTLAERLEAKSESLDRAEEALARLRGLTSFLSAKLGILEAKLDGERFNEEWSHVIDDMKAALSDSEAKEGGDGSWSD